MNSLELVGGPFDGAIADDRGDLSEGDHLAVDLEGGAKAVYTLRNGLLEYDAKRSFES